MNNLARFLLTTAIFLSAPSCDKAKKSSTQSTTLPSIQYAFEESPCEKGTRPHYHFLSGNEDITIKYFDERVLVTCPRKQGDTIMVSGYIRGKYKQKISEHTSRTCVRPITSPGQQTDIESIIRERGLEGPIEFWRLQD